MGKTEFHTSPLSTVTIIFKKEGERERERERNRDDITYTPIIFDTVREEMSICYLFSYARTNFHANQTMIDNIYREKTGEELMIERLSLYDDRAVICFLFSYAS